MQKHLVDLTKISEGITKNRLLFCGYIHRLNPNKEFYFDFFGTDLETNAPLTDVAKEDLLNCLVDDFDFAPYDFQKCKLIFGEGKSYNIQLW